MIHQTYDTSGHPNGSVWPIWSALERPDLRPDQVYMTTVNAGTRKGPHLHQVRSGLFVCVRGIAVLRLRLESGEYRDEQIEPGTDPVEVQPGTACAIYAPRDQATLLNMPNPAWSAAYPDEHYVENWQDPDWWQQ